VTPDQPQAMKLRTLVCYVAAFVVVLLGCAAIYSYLVYARAQATGEILEESREQGFGAEQTIDNLGGREDAALRCESYVSLPDWVTPIDLKKEACGVLERCGKDGVSGLAELLKHPDPTVRIAAMLGLGSIGQDAAEVIPALLKSCEKHGDADVMPTMEAIMRIGPASPDDLDELLRISRSGNANVRLLALYAIAGIQPVGRPALFRLRRAASDEDAFIRKRMATILAGIDGKSPETQAIITKLTRDKDKAVREAAAEVLNKIKAAQDKK
jgi:HEAT repeat protein